MQLSKCFTSHMVLPAGKVIKIFGKYRRKGYGYDAMNRALEFAKEKGYRIASAQIRTDNKASISLHNKVGFETDYYEYVNGRGNKIYLFLKVL